MILFPYKSYNIVEDGLFIVQVDDFASNIKVVNASFWVVLVIFGNVVDILTLGLVITVYSLSGNTNVKLVFRFVAVPKLTLSTILKPDDVETIPFICENPLTVILPPISAFPVTLNSPPIFAFPTVVVMG